MKIKLLFTFLTFFTTLGFTNAQITLDADSLITAVLTGEDDIVGHNTFNNIIPQSRTFRWTRNVIEKTDEWTTAVCDEIQCYLPTVDSKTLEVGPNASSRLDVHVYPNQVYQGYAFVEMFVEDVNTPTSNATAYYIFDSDISTSTQELQRLTFKVYPNPTSGLFRVENSTSDVAIMNVFSLTGQKLKQFTVGERQWYDLANLAEGTYMIQLLDNQGTNLGSKLISKF